MRILIVTGALCLGLSVAAGCAKKPIESAPDVAALRKIAEAQVSIERLRTQKPVNWSDIAAQYEMAAELVKAVDAAQGLNYDEKIRAAIERCAKGDRPDVNQQIVAKGLQHVVVLAVRSELGNLERDPDAANRIRAMLEGTRPTFVRRDKDFFKGARTLEKSADDALARLRGDRPDLTTARRELEDAINRAYALSVLYEVIEIEKLRDTDIPACDVKAKEAEIFYRIIKPRIVRRAPKADQLISGMLSGSYATMDAGLMERTLNEGLAGIPLR